MLPVGDAEGKEVVTIDGLPPNQLVKRAWVMERVPQCGFCRPRIIMQVAYLLSKRPLPNPEEVVGELDDVICRCGTYPRIKRAVKVAPEFVQKEVKK